jgi:DNA-binding beta-propeller fold protein YncE
MLVAIWLLATSSATSADAPFKLVQTIELKGVAGNLDHLAVDAKGMRLFVANKANNTLDVVDLKTGMLVKQIADQGKVSGVAYAADLDMVYVGNGVGVCNGIEAKGYTTVFSTKCEKADNVYYHSGNKMVYVQQLGAIAVLDAKTGDAKAKIDLGGKTEAFRVDKKAGKLFINVQKPSELVVVDLAKNEVETRYKLSMTDGNGPLAYDAAAHLFFVGCGGKKPMVLVVDAQTGKELTYVEIPAGIDDLHFDAKRNRLYASCGDGFLVVIEKTGDSYAVTAKIETAKKAKTSAFNGTLGRLYLGVPLLEGSKVGPEVRVYEALPVIEKKQ